MRNASTTGATRREFLVRSAATAGGAFLSIGLPALLPGGRAEAASSAAMTRLHALDLVHPDPRRQGHDAHREG